MTNSDHPIEVKQYGEQGILLEWPKGISRAQLRNMLSYKVKIQKKYGSLLRESVLGYHSLLLVLDGEDIDMEGLIEEIQLLKKAPLISDEIVGIKRWEIPVCYDKELENDLEVIAQRLDVPLKEVIRLHQKQLYTVYFIGFLPGFLYLGGLDERLVLPRRSEPRLHIPQGAVGIAERQTGIYPQESAGGWHILGYSPLQFFDSAMEPPCFAAPGDQLRFVSIDREQYFKIRLLLDTGKYFPKYEMVEL